MFKFVIIFLLFIFDFFIIPTGFEFFIAPSLVIGGCVLFIFLDKKSLLNQVPAYIPFILLNDILSPYQFGVVTIAFIISILTISLIMLWINFEKNIKSGVIFTGITLTIYYLALNGLISFI